MFKALGYHKTMSWAHALLNLTPHGRKYVKLLSMSYKCYSNIIKSYKIDVSLHWKKNVTTENNS